MVLVLKMFVIANAVVTPTRIDNVENANHMLIMIVSIIIDIYLGQNFPIQLTNGG
jgi:hypothetical protein